MNHRVRDSHAVAPSMQVCWENAKQLLNQTPLSAVPDDIQYYHRVQITYTDARPTDVHRSRNFGSLLPIPQWEIVDPPLSTIRVRMDPQSSKALLDAVTQMVNEASCPQHSMLAKLLANHMKEDWYATVELHTVPAAASELYKQETWTLEHLNKRHNRVVRLEGVGADGLPYLMVITVATYASNYVRESTEIVKLPQHACKHYLDIIPCQQVLEQRLRDGLQSPPVWRPMLGKSAKPNDVDAVSTRTFQIIQERYPELRDYQPFSTGSALSQTIHHIQLNDRDMILSKEETQEDGSKQLLLQRIVLTRTIEIPPHFRNFIENPQRPSLEARQNAKSLISKSSRAMPSRANAKSLTMPLSTMQAATSVATSVASTELSLYLNTLDVFQRGSVVCQKMATDGFRPNASLFHMLKEW
jgi:hypothetical protein